jgi:hypothetical protein
MAESLLRIKIDFDRLIIDQTFEHIFPGRLLGGRAREASAASATCRTRGLPKSGMTSFVSFGPASKRNETPAARTIAAISLNGGIKREDARLRMGVVINQKAANAHPADILAAHGQSSEKPVEHEIEPIHLWRTRAARRTDDWLSLAVTRQRSKQKQIASDPPSKWWTPLISSRGSRKVFDGYSASSIHG